MTVGQFGGAIIFPCVSNNADWLFACGPADCEVANFTMTSSLANQLFLRPTQLSSAVTAAGSSFASEATPTRANSNSSTSVSQTDDNRSQPEDNDYTAGAMAGVGLGVGVPFLIVIGILS